MPVMAAPGTARLTGPNEFHEIIWVIDSGVIFLYKRVT